MSHAEGISAVTWAGLAGAGLLYVLAAFAAVAFRVLSPVTLEALVERVGADRVEFLRASLRSPSAFRFSLTLATSTTLLLFLFLLFGAAPRIGAFGVELTLRPAGRLAHDAVLFGLACAAVVLVEFLLPVLVARIDPVRFVERSLPAMRLVHVAFSPLTRLVAAGPSDGLLDETATSDEVMAYIDVGTREGIIEEDEGRILQKLVTFGETRVYEVMTPRTDVVGVESTATVEELADLMAQSRFSRIPVHRGQLDDVVGVAMIKDAVAALRSGRGGDPVTTIMHPPHLVPESKNVADLLPEFQARRQQLAIVVDEYGGTAGVVTVEDLLEEIVGEIREEHEQPGEDISPAEEGGWIVRGRASLHDVGLALDADIQFEEASTVGGLLLALFERVPVVGEVREHAGHRFEVLQADRRRVLRVRITPSPQRGTGERAQSGAGA